MACLGSHDENSKFTCYVPHGEHIIPLCVSADTRLKDLGGAIREAKSQGNLRHADGEDSKACRSVVLVVASETTDAQRVEIKPEMPKLSLKGFVLYTYMWSTFQWIEPKESGSYSGRLPFAFYKLMLVAVTLSLWMIVIFEIYNLINGLPALLENTDTFAAIVAVMHRLLWTLRYVILHHLGLYFFHAHRGHISDVLNNNHHISRIQWRKSHRLIQDLMAVTAFFLIALPLIQKLIPIFLERANGIPRNWDATVETIEFFVLVYSRVVAMPIFFFFVLVVEIHILELKDFEEQIQHSERNLTDLFNKYKSLTTRIQKSSQAFQPYLIGLLFLLVLWGTISVYSSVEMFQHIPSRHNVFFSVILSESLGTLLVFLCETVFLFSLPLYKSGQISSQLSRLIYVVTTLDSGEQCRDGFVFDTEEKILLFAGLLERHQRYGNVGFKVTGLHITQLKSVWLTLLGPVIVFVGNFLIKEHF
ncbi:uncharacterized protein [Montipora capricornis]|uniref:uncharacterized protein n=1 Tax=Montipora capricornis TaxID=246305 RepID=UPI0035F1525B